jgi:hypothetical protein
LDKSVYVRVIGQVGDHVCTVDRRSNSLQRFAITGNHSHASTARRKFTSHSLADSTRATRDKYMLSFKFHVSPLAHTVMQKN